jgi:hypothetical protein
MVVFHSIPTAASTLVFARQFDVEPDLVAGGSVLNLILSAPLMFMTVMLLTASVDGIIFWSNTLRILSNTLSIIGTLALMVFFWLVPRWHVYPMLLMKDAAIIGFVFSSLHLTCSEFGDETEITSYNADAVIYFVVNSFRLAGRMYALCTAIILLSTIRLALRQDKSVWDMVEFPPPSKWKAWHTRARIAAFTYGVGATFFFTLPGFSNNTAYLGCWFRHGQAQIYFDIAVELPMTVALILILSYSQLHPSSHAKFRGSVECAYLATPGSRRVPSTELTPAQMQEMVSMHHQQSSSSAVDADADLVTAYVKMGDAVHEGTTLQQQRRSGFSSTEKEHSALLPRASWKFLAGVFIGCEVARNVLSLLLEIAIVTNDDSVYTLPTVVYLLFILVAFVDGGGFLLFLIFGLQSDAIGVTASLLKKGIGRRPRVAIVYGIFLVLVFTLVGIEGLLTP